VILRNFGRCYPNLSPRIKELSLAFAAFINLWRHSLDNLICTRGCTWGCPGRPIMSLDDQTFTNRTFYSFLHLLVMHKKVLLVEWTVRCSQRLHLFDCEHRTAPFIINLLLWCHRRVIQLMAWRWRRLLNGQRIFSVVASLFALLWLFLFYCLVRMTLIQLLVKSYTFGWCSTSSGLSGPNRSI